MFNSQYSPKSHNKQAESLLASDLLFTPKAALRSGTAQGKAASKGSFRSSFPLAHEGNHFPNKALLRTIEVYDAD